MNSKKLFSDLARLLLIGALLFSQTNIAWAYDSSPITSPISGPIGNQPTPTPTAQPTSTPTPTTTPTPIPTPIPTNPATNYVAVNLLPGSSTITPQGQGMLTITLTEKVPSGSVGVIERGYISGSFKKLLPNSLYTIWLVEKNFLGYDPVRSDEMLSDQNGDISFFSTPFEVYHRTDQPIEIVNIALRSLDLSSGSCSKYSPCLSSFVTFPTTTVAPTAQPVVTPTPTASPIPVTSPIDDCLNFWIFQICSQNPTPTPTPTATPTATPQPTATPTPSATPVAIQIPQIESVTPDPATAGTFVTISGTGFNQTSKVYVGDVLMTTEFNEVSEDGTQLTFFLSSWVDFRSGVTYELSVANLVTGPGVDSSVFSNKVDLTVAPSILLSEMPALKDNQMIVAPAVSLNSTHPELVLASSNFNTTVTIPSSVTNPILDFTNVLSTFPEYAAAVYNNQLDITSSTSVGNINVQIPALTMIKGPANWDGKISAPKILSNTTATPTADAGKTNTVSSVVEIGAGDTSLTFDRAVRVLLTGQAGKLVGFQRGSTFTKITNNCSVDAQAAILPSLNDCYLSVGNDLVIWTNHFTKFVTYSQTTSDSTGSAGSTNSNSNSNSTTGSPVCVDSKPASAPKLLSAKVTGKNEITLTWSRAADPVTYYLVTYGLKPGSQEYGNPNIGGRETTSYIVKGLQNGQTYYFKVRAGNNCMTGSFSNELSVKALGDKVSGPAFGFKPGVLAAQTKKSSSDAASLKFEPITKAAPQRAASQAGNLLTKVVEFIFSLFSHRS